jgi:hypothetical protein
MEAGKGPGDWAGSTFDLTRIEQDTGLRPDYTIEQALEAYADQAIRSERRSG